MGHPAFVGDLRGGAFDPKPARGGPAVAGDRDEHVAEGRLILADAIVRACEDSPDYFIECSTLTGAQTVTLSTQIPGSWAATSFAPGGRVVPGRG